MGRRWKERARLLLFYVVYPLVYHTASLIKRDDRLIILVTEMFSSLPENFRMMKEELERRGYHCIVMLKPKKKGHRFRDTFRMLGWNLAFQIHYARCRVCFLTEGFLPADANRPRRGTQVIQLWHACGALKKVGYSCLDMPWGSSEKHMKRYNTYGSLTAAMVSSESIVPCYAEAFGKPEGMIHPFGVPRTDLFFQKDYVEQAGRHLRQEYPFIGDKKVILYAPTFRGNNIREAYMPDMLDYRMMERDLAEDFVLLCRPHPLTAEYLRAVSSGVSDSFLLDGTGIDPGEALCAADILITDYSTVMFEYSLLERPMIFLAGDLDKYEADRGFYFDYKMVVPGPVVFDTVQVIEAVCSVKQGFDRKAVRDFRRQFMSGCDGHATERIADFAINHSH